MVTQYDQGHDRAAHEGSEACSTGLGGSPHSRVPESPPELAGRGGGGQGEGEDELEGRGNRTGGVEPIPLEPSAMLGFPGSL